MTRRPSFLSLLTLSALAACAFLDVRPVQAQSGIELENVGASYQFGEQITFVATLKASVPVQSVSIVISDDLSGLVYAGPLNIPPDGQTEFRLDVRPLLLRPFIELTWKYQLTLGDGSMVESAPYRMRYEDDRFPWQRLESGPLQVNWYNGEAGFGQAALQVAQAGLESIGQMLSVDPAQPVEIYIYSSVADLRDTLLSGGEDWVAGHADPALGVVMVVIEPDTEQNIKLEQRIPHELMHVILYRAVGRGYQNIPAWLREGMATLAEMYPNADYERVLSDAAASNDLIPLRDLCVSFPDDAGQAFLAYAESRSFTNYLRAGYGSAGLLDLAKTHADGTDCERGPERAFGASLSNLEVRWRSAALGQNAFVSTLQNISPYLVLLCLVLIVPLIGIFTTLRRKGNRHEPETYVRR